MQQYSICVVNDNISVSVIRNSEEKRNLDSMNTNRSDNRYNAALGIILWCWKLKYITSTTKLPLASSIQSTIYPYFHSSYVGLRMVQLREYTRPQSKRERSGMGPRCILDVGVPPWHFF
jgi:hypothetical protein